MTVNVLHVADELALDADYIAGASLALLGKRGAGKSYASRVLAECLFDAGVKTVILDPMGVFWGLRAAADGTSGGIPIPIFGGAHADAPLEPTAGALMADLVVEENLSMVLDLSGFGSRTQERTFSAAFLDRLYRTNRDLVHLIVDEADLLAPQKPRREDAHLLVTMENIVRRGRNKGIGITMATQRSAVLNKDVLTQVDGLIALRVAAPQDRDAIRDWVRGQGDDETWSKIAPSLPGLANGESWWWIPERGILERVQIRRTRTFDSSPTRKRGQAGAAPKVLADVDIDAIAGRIAATIERAKATDPKELTKRVRELERSLAVATATRPETKIVEAPVIDAEALARLETATRELADMAATQTLAALVDSVRQLVDEYTTTTQRVIDACSDVAVIVKAAAAKPIVSAVEEATLGRRRSSAGTVSRRRAVTPPVNPGSSQVVDAGASGAVTKARLRILVAAKLLEIIGIRQPSKPQLALWAGVSQRSSGYANNLGALRTAELIGYPTKGHVSLTDKGRAAAGPVKPIETEAELHRKVEGLVTPARWRILAALIDAYPASVAKADLAVAAGASPSSSGYANNLGALRTAGLVDYPEPGRVIVTDVLFLTRP